MRIGLDFLLSRLAVVLLLFCSSQAFAAEWQGPFTVKDVRVFYIGNSYHVTFQVNEDLTGQTCANGNLNDAFAYPSMNESSKAMLSVLLSAQAQNKPVMVFVNLHCWASGQGYWGVNLCGDDEDCVAPQ